MKDEEKVYNTAVEVTLEVIGGKWKPVILFHLTFGKKRTSELKKLIPTITQKMLTQQLRELEEAGIVLRTSYNVVPPKVEYELTEYGTTLTELLHMMCKWGEVHLHRQYGDQARIVESPSQVI
ncbi:helix-turn-helix domain-containing protein [Paenibacillus sp. PsM32]|uniref:winged helix-turn-helix transcriptional regulator n=1 Tax=Paenibacillus sp. PsM32 TaxID=3030536 RepID=UPI00263BB659|nr:helix-turn-helix domain-containing protein [Paenibacillus sp. PsM32]MDN4618978.1 helix-turn-helix domain-containing protein [Paenibacillus sp. PsM32]